MKVRDTREEKNTVYDHLLSLTAMTVTAAVFTIVIVSFTGRTGGREGETLEKAITRISVQYYAIGGRYPPSMEYLGENYRVQISRKKYNVFYGDFASNVMPEINITPIEE